MKLMVFRKEWGKRNVEVGRNGSERSEGNKLPGIPNDRKQQRGGTDEGE